MCVLVLLKMWIVKQYFGEGMVHPLESKFNHPLLIPRHFHDPPQHIDDPASVVIVSI